MLKISRLQIAAYVSVRISGGSSDVNRWQLRAGNGPSKDGRNQSFAAGAKLFGATTKADFGPTLGGLLRLRAE